MNQHALRPQLVIYKEVQILLTLIFFPLAFHMLDLTQNEGRVNLARNMKRYKQFFGVDPSTAAPLFRDLRDNFPSFRYKDGLMTLNWLWLNDKQYLRVKVRQDLMPRLVEVLGESTISSLDKTA